MRLDENYNAKTAESAVIGVILQDNTALPRLRPLVRPDQFSIATYRELLELFERMASDNVPIDIVSVAEYLPADKATRLESTLIGCADSVASFDNAAHYAGLIVGKWRLRQFAMALSEARQSLESGDMEEAIAKVQNKIVELNNQETNSDFVSVGDAMIDFYSNLEAVMANPSLVDKIQIKSGFADFDRAFGGLSIGLNVLAARPAMGKTSYALQEAYQIAKSGRIVLFLSLEMTITQLTRRYASMISNVDSTRLTRGQIEKWEMENVANVLSEAQSIGLHFLEPPSDINKLLAKVEEWRLVNGCNPDLVAIDYLGLIEDRTVSRDEYSQVTANSLHLQRYFKEKQIACRLLHQLSRGVENRNDKRPIMSDLRSSGQIEQDAFQISFLYRDDYYNPESEEPGITEVITAKNREGGTGTIKLAWVPETTKFFSIDYGNSTAQNSEVYQAV